MSEPAKEPATLVMKLDNNNFEEQTKTGVAGAATDDGKVPEPAKDPATPMVKLDNFEDQTKTGVAAISLTEANFVSQVSTSPHFVMFYAPWCGDCKRLAPTWEELAGKMNVEKEVTIGKVDCTEQTALCSAQDVTGYPTLKFFKNGAEKEDGVKYRGNRDLASLEKFIKEKLGETDELTKKLKSKENKVHFLPTLPHFR